MQNCYGAGMNLRHLQAFVAIVDSGGFTRAAARLNLSQPALSRQIRALETDLGTTLFERVGRRMKLSSQGEDLLRRSRRLLAESEALIERAHMLKVGETGILRVGATPHVIENLLARFLTSYSRKHPGVEVHLVEDGGTRLHERLARGDVHLVMGPEGGRFASRLLYPMLAIAALVPRHPLARGVSLEISRLADEPLLVLRRGFASREWFDAACSVAHVRQRVLLESAAPHTLLALAATGYGIAIIPSNAQVPRGIRALPLVHRGASVGRWATVAWDAARFLAPYAASFIDEMVAHCRRDYPGHHLVRRAPPLPRPKSNGA
jgi:LysR family transcriptional regulator, cyn operon transcriptional activator